MRALIRKLQQLVAVRGADGMDSPTGGTVLGISDGNLRLGFEIDAAIHHSEMWERSPATRNDPDAT
jgi:hypothetical protein